MAETCVTEENKFDQLINKLILGFILRKTHALENYAEIGKERINPPL